jgi:hypothetical protein
MDRLAVPFGGSEQARAMSLAFRGAIEDARSGRGRRMPAGRPGVAPFESGRWLRGWYAAPADPAVAPGFAGVSSVGLQQDAGRQVPAMGPPNSDVDTTV